MKIPAFLFLLFFLGSCSMPDDGPIPIYSDGDQYEGTGFVLSASLDSGNKIHLIRDTLHLQLSEIWSLANCYLEEIVLEETIQDTLLILTPQIKIRTEPNDCPSPLFRPDTILRLPVKDSWRSVKTIYVEGLPRNQLDPSSGDTASVKDSIWLRSGTFTRDSLMIYTDSLFANPRHFPRRTTGDTSLLRVADTLWENTYYWRTVQAHCTRIVNECENLLADTIFPVSWPLQDTIWVPIRKRCADSTLVYCPAAYWVLDSASLGSIRERKDTTWVYSSYFIQKIPECATFNQTHLSSLTPGRYWTGIVDVFTPDAVETTCGPSSLPGWEIIDLQDLTEIRDTAKAESLLDEWKLAAPGAVRPPEN
ncbi:MAG: hypothetical protein LBR60_03590 [Fibrobacter sp.]|jgi:hypothetical protein|nr:hypothetical protein [Fibrobacter sp.]